MTKLITTGTELRCVDANGSETIDKYDDPFKLEAGKLYKTAYDSSDDFVEVEGGVGILYRAERFEKAEEVKHELVYLSAPYSKYTNKSALMMAIMTISGIYQLRNQGHHVVSPLFNHYSLNNVPGLGSDYAFWKDYSRNLLKRCDKVVVIKAPGWEESSGVEDEVKLAKELGIKVEFVDPTNFGYKQESLQFLL